MREEVRGKRGRWKREQGKNHHIKWEMRKNVPHGTPKDGKGGKKFHMEQTKGTKKPPSTGGFGLFSFII